MVSRYLGIFSRGNYRRNMSFGGKLKSGVLVLGTGAVAFAGLSFVKGNENFYNDFVMPCMRVLDAEKAHNFAVRTAAWGLIPRSKFEDPPSLKTTLLGLNFSNPIGLAAGFDKHAEAMDGMLKIGFGFVEVGSVTPEPQPGNPLPRVFRLTEDKAIINRYGFNSVGHVAAMSRLKERILKVQEQRNENSGIVGINLGKNKTSPDPINDYVKGVRNLGCFGDYLVINVSSPNTPGLRAMQGRKQLAELIDQVVAVRDKLPIDKKPPLLVKIAPDLSEQDKEDIAAVVTRPKMKVDGLIVTNTTITRPSTLQSPLCNEGGGLSGQPLKDLSTKTVSDMYRLTKGLIPIIGVGGVASGQDAYEKIRAGASLVQLYTALTYGGPPLVTRIKRELAAILSKEGFKSVSEAVGADHR